MEKEKVEENLENISLKSEAPELFRLEGMSLFQIFQNVSNSTLKHYI